MSFESMAMVMHHSPVGGTDFVVLMGLANHNGDGGIWPSLERLSRYTKTSIRAVRSSLRRLEEYGLIRTHICQGGNDRTRGNYRPNKYDILLACPPECDGTTNHRMPGEHGYEGPHRSSCRSHVERQTSGPGRKLASGLGGKPASAKPVLEPVPVTPYSPVASVTSSPVDLQCGSVEVSPGAVAGSGSIEDQRKPETPEPRRPVAPPATAPEPPQDRPSGPRTPEPVPAHQEPPVSPSDWNLAPDKNHQAVRKALTRINTEYPFPIGYDELVTELVRIGRGDPWAGYLAAKPAWERPLTDDVRDPAAALRARLRNTPPVQATVPHVDVTPPEHSQGRVLGGSQGMWAMCRQALRDSRETARGQGTPQPA